MKLIAHRGIWNKYIKDNSYKALYNALKSDKYVGIECDLRETMDNKYILYHNPLYNGKLIKNILYKDLNDVCLLEDILKINTDKIILIEIKDYSINIKKILKFLNKYHRNIYLMSFNYNLMKKIYRYNSKYKLGVLNYVLNSDSKYNLDFICLLDVVATDYIIETFKKRNIDVIIYGTINTNRNLTYIVDDNKLFNT